RQESILDAVRPAGFFVQRRIVDGDGNLLSDKFDEVDFVAGETAIRKRSDFQHADETVSGQERNAENGLETESAKLRPDGWILCGILDLNKFLLCGDATGQAFANAKPELLHRIHVRSGRCPDVELV